MWEAHTPRGGGRGSGRRIGEGLGLRQAAIGSTRRVGWFPSAPPCSGLLVLISLVLLTAACHEGGRGSGWECVAPANVGGGWDLTCRAFSRTVNDLGLAPGLMRVGNLPGAGGGIGYAHMVGQRGGDEAVLAAASPATLLRLAQGQFAHLTEDDVRWVGAIAADHGVVAVRPDAPWDHLEDFLDFWRRDPRAVRISGGSASGGQDHVKMLLLAQEAGMDPRSVRYIPFDGGGEAMTALLGGFVEVFSGDVTQVDAQVEAGRLRVLAILAADRVGGALADVPTATERGYPVTWVTWRGFYLPPGISAEGYDRWVRLVEEVAASDEWALERERSRLAPWFLVGRDFEDFVQGEVRNLRQLSRQVGLLP